MSTNPIIPPTPPPERPFGPLWRIALAIALLATLALIIALWPFLRALSSALTAAAVAWDTWIAGALLLFVGALLIGVVRAVWAWSWRIDAGAPQARVIRMQNDLPISVDDVHAAFEQHAAWSLHDHYAVGLAEAQRQFPLLTSYNQHMQTTHAPPAQLAAPAETVTTVAQIPTFAQLLDSGQIGPDKPLILGYNASTGQPLTGAWKDLYSCGVGALQGAGKTWLLAFLLGQSAAAGGRLIICDLHAGDDESLANRIGALAPAFMCDVASTPKEIESAFAFADDKLEKRKGNSARWPIVIVADEWTSLLRTSAGANLPLHIQNIAEQGRKFNVNGMLAAQAWTKAASSDVRNQLTSHYVLRQRPDEARYQLGLRAEQLPDDIRALPDATGYLLNVQGELIKIVVPRMTAADLARCGELIPSPAGSPPKFGFLAPTDRLPLPSGAPSADGNGTATGRQRDGSAEVPATAAQSGKPRSPEAMRAAALFIGGKAIPEIVEELRGVSSTSGGRAYRAARDDIEALIREGVQA
jgi:hypothetical protein